MIKFFRGRWCPYCMTELEAWRDLYGQIREHGALMAAIGPQIQRQSDFMVGQHGLPFPVLTDTNNEVAEKFGLVYTVPEYHRDLLPVDPGEHSFRERREELAAAVAGDVCGGQGPEDPLSPRPMRIFGCGRSRKRRWRRCWQRFSKLAAGSRRGVGESASWPSQVRFASQKHEILRKSLRENRHREGG